MMLHVVSVSGGKDSTTPCWPAIRAVAHEIDAGFHEWGLCG